MRPLTVAAVVVGVTLASSGEAVAQFGLQRQALEPVRDGGFETSLTTDLISASGMLVAGVLVDREKGSWTQLSPCEGEARAPTAEERAAFAALGPREGACDRSRVFVLDRPVTELDWSLARPLSDAGLISMVLLPFGVSAFDAGLNGVPARNVAIDSLVIGQTLSGTLLATALLKVAVRRPRPFTYNPNFDKADRFAGDARLSFPSGHTSMAFAAASVTAVMLTKRYPGQVGAGIGVAGAYVGAATVGLLRVLGGKHFITDVLAGAVLGTALGLAIPLAHTSSGETTRDEVGQDLTIRPIVQFGAGF